MLELCGAFFGVLYVWLTTRQNVWCWPIGIVYILISYVVFFQAHLYAELFSHTVYFILTFYGWHAWLYGGNQKQALRISRLPIENMGALILLSIIASTIFGLALSKLTDNAWPYMDATLAILSFVGMWLSARKKIENWVLWAVINLVSIGLYSYQQIFWYAGLYALFFVLAIVGHRQWRLSESHS